MNYKGFTALYVNYSGWNVTSCEFDINFWIEMKSDKNLKHEISTHHQVFFIIPVFGNIYGFMSNCLAFFSFYHKQKKKQDFFFKLGTLWWKNIIRFEFDRKFALGKYISVGMCSCNMFAKSQSSSRYIPTVCHHLFICENSQNS